MQVMTKLFFDKMRLKGNFLKLFYRKLKNFHVILHYICLATSEQSQEKIGTFLKSFHQTKTLTWMRTGQFTILFYELSRYVIRYHEKFSKKYFYDLIAFNFIVHHIHRHICACTWSISCIKSDHSAYDFPATKS